MCLIEQDTVITQLNRIEIPLQFFLDTAMIFLILNQKNYLFQK